MPTIKSETLNAASDSQQRGAMPHVELEIVRGRAKNMRRRIDVPVFLIGSANDCDLMLADSSFPEVHTYLYVTPAGVSVRHLGEGPELSIDDRVVHTAPLQNGQRLRLGDYEFALYVDPPHGLKKHRPRAADSPGAPEARETPYADSIGIAKVHALLGDIRDALRVESGLRLYVEPAVGQRASA